jgi:predicted DNA-binding transcriptional regulator YafY
MPLRIRLYGLALITLSSSTLAQRPLRANEILAAAELPVSAAHARKEGVSSRDVREALDAMRTAKVPARDAQVVIDEERIARRTNGPMDNFGAFVQSKLQAGLRGRDLAAAIKAEHAARGKNKAGKPNAPGVRTKTAAPTRAKASVPAKRVTKQPQRKKKATVEKPTA